MTNVFVKHWRLVALALGIILFIWVLYLLRTFVLPFAIGLVLAYLMMPLVGWMERHIPPRNKWPGFRRVFSVIVAFILLLAIIGGFVYVIVSAVMDASVKLVESAPYFIGQSVIRVQEWIEGIISRLPVEMQEELTAEIVEGGVSLGRTIRSALMGAVSSIPGTFNLILGFAVLPFFLFYVLKDSDKLKHSLATGLPHSVSWHGRNIVDIVERVLGRYIRAQLMLGLIVGYFSFVGLLLLDVPFPLALALLAGVGELIPTLGPWIAGAVAVVVAIAMAPDKAIWVAVLYMGIQLVENNLLVPKIQSAYLRIHPAVMIVLLVFGAYIAGFWGILLIGPLTATLVEIFKYVRERYRSQNPPEELKPPAVPETLESP
ncbi:MAG: AI-2E family transporter [Dehalococcoidales bacterium]|nr:AI-2E family transporter [Dehalococcoidales bacterium]